MERKAVRKRKFTVGKFFLYLILYPIIVPMSKAKSLNFQWFPAVRTFFRYQTVL